jgi:hypothetical protein
VAQILSGSTSSVNSNDRRNRSSRLIGSRESLEYDTSSTGTKLDEVCDKIYFNNYILIHFIFITVLNACNIFTIV